MWATLHHLAMTKNLATCGDSNLGGQALPALNPSALMTWPPPPQIASFAFQFPVGSNSCDNLAASHLR